MSAIEPGQGLAAAMRQQLAARGSSAPRSEARRRSAPAAAAAGAVSAVLAQQVQAIPAADPDRPHKAVRLFLACELAREFGHALLNDPAFPALLDAVQQQLQEDPQTAAEVEALGRLLLTQRIASR
jgi:hypothetical protein